MRKIEIDLTKEQEIFLKQYAKLFNVERDLDCTSDPIVVVENKEYIITDNHNIDSMKYLVDDDGELISFETFDELLSYLKYDLDIDFEELTQKEKKYIKIAYEQNDYFKIRGHKFESCGVISYYTPVAYFLTRCEAEKYIEYQAHNLKEPRVYTRNIGYKNYGDLNSLTKLLLKIGNELNEKE